MRLVGIAIMVILSGCWSRSVADATSIASDAAHAVTEAGSGDDTELADLRRARDELAGKLADADSRLKSAERSRDEERIEGHRRYLAGLSMLAMLGIVVCGALAVFIPVMKGRMLMAAAACGAALLLSQLLDQALAWIAWIRLGGLAVVGLAVAGLIVALYLRLRASVRSVHVAIDKEDESWPALRGHLMRAQGGEGSLIQQDLDRMARALRKPQMKEDHQ